MQEPERVVVPSGGGWRDHVTACGGGGVRAEGRSGGGRLDLQSSNARPSPEK